MSRKILLLFISLITFYISACRSDEPTATGADFLGQDLINLDSLDSFEDTLQQISSSHISIAPLSNSDMLLVGKNNLNTASTLISFYFGMPDTLINYIKDGSLVVQKAYVDLYVTYKLGTPTPGFNFTAHEVTKYWTPKFTSDSLQGLTYNNENAIISPLTFTQGDSTVNFEISPALVSKWFTAEADPAIPADNGLLLSPQSATGILGFNSTTASVGNFPMLSVVVSKEGWGRTDTLSFVPAIDLSVVQGIVPTGNPENIYVQSGVFINSYLRFDLSKVPKKAVINYAELELTRDSTASVVGAVYTDAMIASLLTDSTKKDSSISSISLFRSGNLYKGNIAPFVQYWISTDNNHGILLRAGSNFDGVDLFAIKGSNAAPVERPRLKIIYTNKK